MLGIPAGIIEFFIPRFDDPWYFFVPKVIAWAVIFWLLAVKTFDHVDEGQLALRKRGGKVVRYRFGSEKEAKVYGPGLKVMIPFLDSYWKIVTQRRQIELRSQTQQKDGHYFNVIHSIAFRITDIEKALVPNQDIDAIVVATCDAYIVRSIREETAGHLIGERMVADREVRATLESLGVELISAILVNDAETDNSQLAWSLKAAGVAVAPAVALDKSNGNGKVHHPTALLES